MITKAIIIDFFSKSKIIIATVITTVTFSITLYNQFKTSKTTEISGFVSADRDIPTPVDAIVRISSPIQAQTETDGKGRFKFKIQNLQSDTFLLVVQNKRTNIITKQNEYVSASSGRTDIMVLFNAEGGIYTSYDKNDSLHQGRRKPSLKKIFRGLFR
jgi:hypothetical protein